ncbi:TRAP transporter, DctM subunit [Fictibacillus solisalsi]|uniref:TRAP transporter, DctM subunit n=1 Tax=Fictibacillus solisalsi TaxID=459525 RepID=A0A1G9VLQ7_9BACL|nr:TRAP transporter large permease [Fictibacillus solisalsi]SDM72755.1 TRAP transporter, DctM subunit [Fictibacillus solisalsi]
MTLTAGILLLSIFFILLFVGVPIAISIAGASIATMLILFPFDIAVFTSAQKMVTGLDSFALLAIPFFILSGIIMNNGGIALRLINVAKLLSGRLPGSLAHTNVMGNMLFGSISGSSVAAAAAIGGVMSPIQKKEGYDQTYSAAVNIASAPTGLLIPPSGLLIIYSLVSGGTSVAALFMAGYVPGILWGIATMVVAYVIAKKKKYLISQRIPLKEGLKVIWEAIPSLMLIVIVLGGIIAGIFTATEGAAIAVAYSLILSMVYRTFKWNQLPKMLLETVEMTAVIMLLIGTSTILSLVMSFTGIPEAISQGLLGFTDNPVVILLIMNIILLIIGTFMDITPAVLIFTPIFLPIVSSFGMDPVHFGIMVAFNLCIGNITPPVGSALFVGASVGKVKIEQVVKPLLPFYAVIIMVLMIVTFIPQVSLALPKLFGL